MPAHNPKKYKKNIKPPKSGVTGVCWCKKDKAWKCNIRDDQGKAVQKQFKDFFEAICWRKSKELEYGYSDYVMTEEERIEYKKKIKSEIDKRYRIKNIEKLREYDRSRSSRCVEYKRKRLKTDPLFKLQANLRGRIAIALRRNNNKKHTSTTELIGCTVQDFRKHIEAQFEPWMNWGNMGKYDPVGPRTWQIDHIIPISHFDLSNPQEQKKAFHYTNCRPLCSEKNIKKGNRI